MIYNIVGAALPQALNKIHNAPPGKTYTTDIVTTMGFLIGMSDDLLRIAYDRGEMKPELVEKLKKNDDAQIMRSLCLLRKQFLIHYERIKEGRYNLIPIENMTEYLCIDDIKYLQSKDIDVVFVKMGNCNEPAIYISYINQNILERVDRIKNLFPDWIKFNYVRSLFLMPGAYAGHKGENVKTPAKQKGMTYTVNGEKFKYRNQFKSYPYSTYLNWPRDFQEDDGNILKNDRRFLDRLYKANKDSFKAFIYVTDVPEEKKESIYSFIDGAKKISIFVDCENVNPYSFVAMLLNLNPENLSKINKIFLYDDVNTPPAWDLVSQQVEIPIEHYESKRVVGNKSLIDVTMTTGVVMEYCMEHTDSIILASSDSDFWGLISNLKKRAEQYGDEVRFYVMNEQSRTSEAIIKELDKNKIEHCFMDKFAQDKVQDFKTKALVSALSSRIREFNETGVMFTTDVNELVDGIFKECYIMENPMQIKQEKEQFYKKFLKQGLLLKPEEGADGSITLQMDLNKTK